LRKGLRKDIEAIARLTVAVLLIEGVGPLLPEALDGGWRTLATSVIAVLITSIVFALRHLRPVVKLSWYAEGVRLTESSWIIATSSIKPTHTLVLKVEYGQEGLIAGRMGALMRRADVALELRTQPSDAVTITPDRRIGPEVDRKNGGFDLDLRDVRAELIGEYAVEFAPAPAEVQVPVELHCQVVARRRKRGWFRWMTKVDVALTKLQCKFEA
jgi:hypothetical protein